MHSASETEFTKQDHLFMQRAISLAKQGHFTTSPNPRVGCVIVNNGEIVGEGFHQKAGQGHAEVNALAMAGDQAKGATAYVTLEPCSHFGRTPPCAQGLIKAQVKHVISAMVDPNPQVSGRGIKMLEQAGISTQVGLLNQDALALNPGFIKLMTTGLPFVRCKLAASIDGKTAMASGESKWITGPEARKDVQRLRAQSCAVITSAQSVIEDSAKMNVRWSELSQQTLIAQSIDESQLRQPIRVIIDTKNRLTPELALFQCASPVIIIRKAIENLHQWPHFVEQVECETVLASDNDNALETPVERINLIALLKILAKRGLNDVLVEAGHSLAGAFIEQNLVDELTLYQAPKLLGAEGKSLVDMPTIEKLSDAKSLVINDLTMVGKDIRITASIKNTKQS